MKIFNTIVYITSFVLAVLVFAPAAHAGVLIDVVFEQDPLFANANIMPGDSETRSISVTNKTSNTLTLGIDAYNVYDCTGDPYCLADVLYITIEESDTVLYANSLANFFTAGQVVLGGIGPNVSVEYDVSVEFSFNMVAPDYYNAYQTLSTYFDIDIGVIDENSGGGSGGSTGGGGISGGSGTTTGSGTSAGTPRLIIEKTGDTAVVPGLTGSFTLVVANQGNAIAYDVSIIDTLPAGFTFVSTDTQTRSWDVGNLGIGATTTIPYIVNVPEGAAGQYTNIAVVAAGNSTIPPLYDSVEYPFTATQVQGFQAGPDETAGSVLGDEANGDTAPEQQKVQVLGFEYEDLPVTGGDILAVLGIDSGDGEPPQAVTRVWVFGLFLYLALMIAIGIVRLHRRALER